MKNVLLVDDDSVSNFIHERTLRLTGLTADIRSAMNGREALEMFTGYYNPEGLFPDLILLDINMPIMNGFEFLQAFNRLMLPERERIKIVMLSSSDYGKDVELAKTLGVFRYAIKPLMLRDVLALLAD